MNKKIVEETVAKNEDIFEQILHFAERKSWVFISGGLNERLKEEYSYYPYASVGPEGNIFQIKKEAGEWQMHVDKDCCWNKVTLLAKENRNFREVPRYLSSNPEIIVFLSEK